MKLTKDIILRLKLHKICIIGLYNVLYNKQDYHNTLNSLISLRNLWEKYPDRQLSVNPLSGEREWVPCNEQGKTYTEHDGWYLGRKTNGKKKLQKRRPCVSRVVSRACPVRKATLG